MSRRPAARVSAENRRRLLALVLAALAVPAALLGRPAILQGEAAFSSLLLTFLFAVTLACPVDLRLFGRTRRISLTGVPLAAGLLVAHPDDLLTGRVLAVLIVAGLWQRRGRRTALDVMPALAGMGSALLVVRLLLAPAGSLSGGALTVPPTGSSASGLQALVLAGMVLVAVPLACLVEKLAERLLAGDGVRLLRRGPARWRLALQPAARCAGTGLVLALVGVTAAFAAPGGEAVLDLGLTGSAVLLAHRGYVWLTDRQVSLERLYELSGALTDAPTRSDVVGLALERAAELLRAGYAEVVLADADGSRPISWSLRAGHGVSGPQDCSGLIGAVAGAGTPFAGAGMPFAGAGMPFVGAGMPFVGAGMPFAGAGMPFAGAGPTGVRDGTAGRSAFLAARGVREALVVPLRVDGALRGHLAVAVPSCDVVGFSQGDLRLLETVANHASIALRNAQLVDRLNFEARHDELTGLPNRLQFRELLDAAAQRAAVGPERCSVMLLDFDGFKAINDTLGHQTGDDLLRVLAGRLAVAAGDDALVARLGGDEFAVLSTQQVTAAEAGDLAGRLMSVFDEPVAVAGTRLRIGGSLGIALGPRQGRTGSDLMRNADIAMYAAKEDGSGIRLYSDDLMASSAATLALASDLPDAIAEDRIDIAVQPIVGLTSGALHSVEVLARWRHPEQGEVDPRDLFEAAERSGQVTALSLRILDRALRLSRAWQDAGSPLRVCVNLAPRWLADSELPDHVAAALACHGLPPDALGLEITERSVIADPNRAIQTLRRLRDLGVHLSVDDFGTGYSSLTYLSRLPVDQLKIDNTFVQAVTTHRRDQAIVSSIVHLGGSLGLEVVAEGVSDPQTRAVLLRMGCLLGQGYLFTRPIDPQALDAFVASRSAAVSSVSPVSPVLPVSPVSPVSHVSHVSHVSPVLPVLPVLPVPRPPHPEPSPYPA